MKTAALVLLPLLVACGGPTSSTTSDGAELSSAPTPFALQFAGTYLGKGPLSRLDLRPDGSYLATLPSGVEGGHFWAARVKALPLELHLRGRSRLAATVAAYDGRLHTGDTVLQLQRPATSDEELCDGSGGAWTDDDADPQTGLYCICPAPGAFIPAGGGCVSP